MGLPEGQIPGQIHPDDLPAVTGGRIQLSQRAEFSGHSAGLLLQLPDGGLPGILSILQFSRRKLPQDLLVGIPELAHQQRPVLTVQGQYAHAAGVVCHLPKGLPAVGQPDGIPPDMEDAAVKNLLTGYLFFNQIHTGPPLSL